MYAQWKQVIRSYFLGHLESAENWVITNENAYCLPSFHMLSNVNIDKTVVS